jgi:hypothetical protein
MYESYPSGSGGVNAGEVRNAQTFVILAFLLRRSLSGAALVVSVVRQDRVDRE